MLEKLALSDLTLIESLKTNYGLEVSALTFLPLGADLNSSVYKAETTDTNSYFVKLKTGHHHDTSLEIAQLLHVTGITEVIAPIKTTDGKPSQTIENYTLIVYPFAKGENGFTRSLTEDQWIRLGKALRKVHELKVPQSMQNRLRKETYSEKCVKLLNRSMITYKLNP